MSMRTLDTFWSERNGSPNELLAAGPRVLVEENIRPPATPGSPKDKDTPAGAKPGELIYLLGDSAPFYFPGPLMYHTTWDHSPLGDAVRRHEGPAQEQARAWTQELRDRGISVVIINTSELARLSATGWYDPAVTPNLVRDWIRADRLAVWPIDDAGRVLVRLGAAPGTPGNAK
jgi:hypothetical protein